MSDSSEDEDLSRFREVVDTSFMQLIKEGKGQISKEGTNAEKPKSQRFLEEASHYTDVKLPEVMQKRIWAKVSAIIQKNTEFTNGDDGIKKRKIKDRIKLFKNSELFLSPEEAKNTYTQNHRTESIKINKTKKRPVDADDNNIEENDAEKPKSQRFLEEPSHYTDEKLPEVMQKRIWAKVSTIIQKNTEFADGENEIKKRKIKNRIKLFQNSELFLSAEEAKDTYTQNHNRESKKINKMRRRHVDADDNDIEENDKVKAVAVSGDYILAKEDTKCWKSRRKEKLFKYKGKKKSKVLTLVD